MLTVLQGVLLQFFKTSDYLQSTFFIDRDHHKRICEVIDGPKLPILPELEGACVFIEM